MNEIILTASKLRNMTQSEFADWYRQQPLSEQVRMGTAAGFPFSMSKRDRLNREKHIGMSEMVAIRNRIIEDAEALGCDGIRSGR